MAVISSMSSGAAELAIVIVNHNSSPYLHACLQSIVEQTDGLRYEVVVVDNASTERGLSHLSAIFPTVTIVQNAENVGFSRANNIGFCRTTAPYVLFLNPDTIIRGSALSTMVNVLNELDDAALVGCRLLNSDLTLQTSCIQRYPTIVYQLLGASRLQSAFPRWRFWGLTPLFETNNTPVAVDVISGACLMVRRTAFAQIGMFSEEYFMYADDVDLCYKAVQAGWRCYYFGGATVIHHGGGSTRRTRGDNRAVVLQFGAKWQFLLKTRGPAYAHLFRCVIGASSVVRCVLACLAGVLVDRDRREQWHAVTRKWAAICKWALRPRLNRERVLQADCE